MKKRLFLLLIAALVFTGSVISAHASDSFGIKSKGRIVFTNDTDDASDDVVFDASDFSTLASKCQ